MFVIPTDIHGQLLKPNIYSLLEQKQRKPNRIAKLSMPQNVQYVVHEVPVMEENAGWNVQYPPRIQKIYAKWNNQDYDNQYWGSN